MAVTPNPLRIRQVAIMTKVVVCIIITSLPDYDDMRNKLITKDSVVLIVNKRKGRQLTS
jgi:hypothetical protein